MGLIQNIFRQSDSDASLIRQENSRLLKNIGNLEGELNSRTEVFQEQIHRLLVILEQVRLGSEATYFERLLVQVWDALDFSLGISTGGIFYRVSKEWKILKQKNVPANGWETFFNHDLFLHSFATTFPYHWKSYDPYFLKLGKRQESWPKIVCPFIIGGKPGGVFVVYEYIGGIFSDDEEKLISRTLCSLLGAPLSQNSLKVQETSSKELPKELQAAKVEPVNLALLKETDPLCVAEKEEKSLPPMEKVPLFQITQGNFAQSYSSPQEIQLLEVKMQPMEASLPAFEKRAVVLTIEARGIGKLREKENRINSRLIPEIQLFLEPFLLRSKGVPLGQKNGFIQILFPSSTNQMGKAVVAALNSAKEIQDAFLQGVKAEQQSQVPDVLGFGFEIDVEEVFSRLIKEKTGNYQVLAKIESKRKNLRNPLRRSGILLLSAEAAKIGSETVKLNLMGFKEVLQGKRQYFLYKFESLGLKSLLNEALEKLSPLPTIVPKLECDISLTIKQVHGIKRNFSQKFLPEETVEFPDNFDKITSIGESLDDFFPERLTCSFPSSNFSVPEIYYKAIEEGKIEGLFKNYFQHSNLPVVGKKSDEVDDGFSLFEIATLFLGFEIETSQEIKVEKLKKAWEEVSNTITQVIGRMGGVPRFPSPGKVMVHFLMEPNFPSPEIGALNSISPISSLFENLFHDELQGAAGIRVKGGLIHREFMLLEIPGEADPRENALQENVSASEGLAKQAGFGEIHVQSLCPKLPERFPEQGKWTIKKDSASHEFIIHL